MPPPGSEREMHALTWTAKKWLQLILTSNLSPDPRLLYLFHFRGRVGMHQDPLMGLGFMAIPYIKTSQNPLELVSPHPKSHIRNLIRIALMTPTEHH